MFATLFAQEIRDNRKGIGGIFLVYLIVVAVSALGILLSIPILTGFLRVTLAFVSAMIPMVLLIWCAYAYWTTMSGVRAYFTHSIPVRGRDIYWAKTLFAFLIALVGFVAMLAGAFVNSILYARSVGMSPWQNIEAFIEFLHTIPTWLIIVVLLHFVVNVALWVFGGAAIMSISAQGRWNRHGFLAPAIGLIFLYFAVQILNLVGMFVFPGSLNLGDLSFSWEPMLPSFLDSLRTGTAVTRVGILASLPAMPILTVLLMWWGIVSIEKRTSLR